MRGRLFPRAVGVRRCRWVKAKKSARVSPTLLVLIFGGIRCRFLLADKPQADGLGNII